MKYRQVILHVNPRDMEQSFQNSSTVWLCIILYLFFFVPLESERLFRLGCNPSTACHALFIDCPKKACQKRGCQYTHAFLHYLPQNRHAFLHYCLKTDMTFHRHDFLHYCQSTGQPLYECSCKGTTFEVLWENHCFQHESHVFLLSDVAILFHSCIDTNVRNIFQFKTL